MIHLLILLFLVIISFFVLFELSKNDFVLLRRNISLTQVFDYTFLTLAGAMIVSRLFFILDNQKFEYLHPIDFLHIARLPGLSNFGFFLGSATVLFIIFYRKKVLRRVYDIFFLALYPIFIFSIIIMRIPRSLFFVPIVLLVLSVVIFALLIRSLRNYSLKDGSIAAIFFALLSLFTITDQFVVKRVELVAHLSLIQIVSTGVLAISLVLLLINQRIIKLPKS